jgi:hypothetical protein
MIGSEGARHVAEAIKVSVLLRLFWYQFHAHLTSGSTAVVCHYPQDMRALLSLNLAANNLGQLVLPAGYKKTPYMQQWTHSDGSKVTENPAEPEGVIAIADVIPDMRALTKLILKHNGMLTKAAGRALASALAGNSVLTELDLSDQAANTSHDDGPGFATELAVGISDNGALTKLDISNNCIGAKQEVSLQRFCVASGIELAK